MGEFKRGGSFGRRDGPGRRDSGFRPNEGGFGGRRDSGRLEMHTVKCDRCGQMCEVPFKPTSNKPVYCRDCFKKKGPSGSESFSPGSNGPGLNKAELTEINDKLNRILAILEREK
jgi:CxxC-x17-CxxC domain-containing protein